ncbi:elongator complex protein 3 [Anaerococcus octavius]|uniref:elongator complex protein 3 n=1 Tax=Anaerococcus octavius TaxID=54007 RepID=UPI00235636A4|nr:radical SAM protein [Anaerococcus octavius]
MTKKEYIIPIFIPFLGCPHDCAFCNQIKITNYKDKMEPNKVIGEIEKNLAYFPKNNNLKEIAFFGGSFTGLDKDVMVGYLEIAKEYKEKGIIDRIRLSTRPDYINNSILDILKEYKVDIIELGIQSLSQDVLDANERGHSVKTSYEASQMIKDYGFTLGHQIMPGLFNDTYKKTIDTVIKSIKIGPDIVRIYPTLVIKDTKLEVLYNEDIYHPLTIDQAVKISAEAAMLYKYAGVNIIRIGLQTTENINEGADVVAGPFHPAFRQLVEAEIYRKYIEEIIKCNSLEDQLTIFTNNRNISLIAGNNKANKEYFYNKYKIKLKFKASNKEFILYNDKKIEFNVDRFIENYVKENYGGDLLLGSKVLN